MTAIVLRGDARALPLPDASVDLIVTSVPYWGLRNYTDGGESLAGQIGSEDTPQEWLANLIDCTREWVRVLKPSGSLFVNCGDKYDSGTTTGRVNPGTVKDGQGQGWHQATPRVSLGRPKSLLGLPWRYALACTDQLGLILRRDIIWAKPNGLPESVTDRCRSSHEYVFHMTRSPRYYSAVDAIREPHSEGTHPGRTRTVESLSGNGVTHRTFTGNTDLSNALGKLPGSVWSIPSQPLQVPAHLGVDHFAAYPVELPRRCVLGWSPPGICTSCGEGRRPVVDKTREVMRPSEAKYLGVHDPRFDGTNRRHVAYIDTQATITGYVCACTIREAARGYNLVGWTPPPTRPAVVLDPFGGTGTTALVASMHGRTGVSIDRSADYTRLARWRVSDPGERAKALQVPKPPPVMDGQDALFGLDGHAS